MRFFEQQQIFHYNKWKFINGKLSAARAKMRKDLILWNDHGPI